MRICVDDPGREQVARLLREHLADMALHSPPESNHALDIEALRSPRITFWSACEGPELRGCGALTQLEHGHGEIKSMHTAAAHRRAGVAAAILAHIMVVAQERGYPRLSLETGSMAALAPARALYSRFGFEYCGPFAGYVLDPNSLFMTCRL